MFKKIIFNIQSIIKKWFEYGSSSIYPKYILDKLSNEELIESLIHEGYQTPFDFIDLKEIHQNNFNENNDILNQFKSLKNKKIDKSEFDEINGSEYWIINYKNLLYVFNGEKIFPLKNMFFSENHNKWFLYILYIPQTDIIKSNRDNVDYLFFRDTIFGQITDINIQRNFLERYSFLFNGFEGNLDYLTHKSNLKFDDKVELLYERNELDFIVLIYLIYKDKLNFDMDKILKVLFSKGKKEHQDIIKITKTSDKILSNDELINLIKSQIFNKKDFLTLFKVEIINQFLENGGLFNPKSLITEIYNLDLDFYYFSSYNSYEKTFKNHEFEYKSKEKLNKFKKNYFREIRETLRKFENQIRIEKGFNLVGTFTNETILFQNLKTRYSDYIVVSQGSPKWLGLQRIDIYFPEYNIGIEYHGEQHFVPIDYFGGEDGLKKNKERDNRKLRLCIENGCKLFIVDKEYDFVTLCKQIDDEIVFRKKSN